MFKRMSIACCGASTLLVVMLIQVAASGLRETIAGPAVVQQHDSVPACDPTKVVSSEACAQCHIPEAQVWRQTPHHQTFYELHRDPRARDIAGRLGIRSIKRNDLCSHCHFTQQQVGARVKTIAGVSCESCHGAGRDWVRVHNDYGGPGASRAAESPEHRRSRIQRSIDLGMRNPRNAYLVARSCLDCHTVPHEHLVNVGGHSAGSIDFELVSWSQGTVRHNFLSSGGRQNQPSDVNRLRVLYLSGLVADLEFSTRAVAIATRRDRYGIESAQRAARVATRLHEIQQQLQNPELAEILRAFLTAELRTNNREALTAIADQVRDLGLRLAAVNDGSKWSSLDPFLPNAAEYR